MGYRMVTLPMTSRSPDLKRSNSWPQYA